MAYDAFLKIEGLLPAVQNPEIQVESFSFGVNHPNDNATGGGGAGRLVFTDLNIVKLFDKASPALFSACANGKRFTSATLDFSKTSSNADGSVFRFYKMYDVVIDGVRDMGNRHGDVSPTEEVSFDFLKIEIGFGDQKVLLQMPNRR